jgi:iron complex transport system ATP-binding protein
MVEGFNDLNSLNNLNEDFESLEVEGLSFAYGERTILRDIDLTLKPGELLGILGANGSGKSTLFRCILGFEKTHTGKVLLNGGNISEKTPSELARLIAYVPQTHHPSFNYSVMDMVLMGTAAQINPWSLPGPAQRKNAEEALEMLGIADLSGRGFRQLSGGEQQLVLIARALAQQARLLIMDEPTANLDYGNQLRLLYHIKALSRRGFSIFLSTHNPDHAFFFADRILALHQNRIAASGPPSEVLTPALIKDLYQVDVQIRRTGGRTGGRSAGSSGSPDSETLSCIPLLP